MYYYNQNLYFIKSIYTFSISIFVPLQVNRYKYDNHRTRIP